MDDANDVREYVTLHCKRFMTEFELQCYRIGGRMVKASSFPDEEIREKARQWWDQYDESAVKSALENGFDAFKSQLIERLVCDAKAGRIRVNRCPKCKRIARTPLAKQCRWCHYDWHDA